MVPFNFSFRTQNNTLLTGERAFYKSGKKALIIIAHVEEGILSYQDVLIIKDTDFGIKNLQIAKSNILSAEKGKTVGIELEAKPSVLHKIGVQVEF